MKKWYELTIGTSRTNVESCTLLIRAGSMGEAIKIYLDNQGYTTLHGEVKECREVYYVWPEPPSEVK